MGEYHKVAAGGGREVEKEKSGNANFLRQSDLRTDEVEREDERIIVRGREVWAGVKPETKKSAVENRCGIKEREKPGAAMQERIIGQKKN